jgi:nucleoside diphosphate-linked moiety X motif protein 19
VLRKTDSSEPFLPPLIFRHPTEPSPSNSSKGVTKVEEEPRGLHPDSKYQFEKKSRLQEQGTKSVTSVEPQALPRSGSNVKKENLYFRGNGESQTSSIAVPPNSSGKEDDGNDGRFVFPLVLPGDFLASKAQVAKMSGIKPSNDTVSGPKALNRVYVEPRSREDGGGLIVRGARRRGLPGLIDFEEGAQLEEMGVREEEEDENIGSAKL